MTRQAICIKNKWSVKNGLNRSPNHNQFIRYLEDNLKIHHFTTFFPNTSCPAFDVRLTVQTLLMNNSRGHIDTNHFPWLKRVIPVLSMHQNHQEECLKHRFLGPIPRVFGSTSSRSRMFYRVPGLNKQWENIHCRCNI